MNTLILKLVAFFLIFWMFLLFSGCARNNEKPISDMSISELMKVEVK
jgi:hypothetical protein